MTEVCNCSEFVEEVMHRIKKWRWLIQLMISKSLSSTKGFQMPIFWSIRCEDRFNTEQHHPQFSLQKKGQSGEESPKRGPFPSWKTDRLLDLRVFPDHKSQWFCPELSIINDANPIWWHLGKCAQIKNTGVWEIQDRIGTVKYWDSSEENRTWLSQIEDNGEQNNRADSTNQEFWGQKRKLWKKRRGQESGDKTAWTKKSRRFVDTGKVTGSVQKDTRAVSDTIWRCAEN